MATKIKPLIAGNWKMNGTLASLNEINKILESSSIYNPFVDLLICPPATLLHLLKESLNESTLALGGQNCHFEQSGAYTGDISAEMLREVGASYVIVGHSERRTGYAESNELVRSKVLAAWSAKLATIICIGETQSQRESGRTKEVVLQQIKGSVPEQIELNSTVIAYEPVWAIGTGLTPTVEEIAEIHNIIRETLVERLGKDGEAIRLLYGGSVKPDNATNLMAPENVNGALVGGASLKAEDFLQIASVYLNN